MYKYVLRGNSLSSSCFRFCVFFYLNVLISLQEMNFIVCSFLVLTVTVIRPYHGLNFVLIPYDGVVACHRRS